MNQAEVPAGPAPLTPEERAAVDGAVDLLADGPGRVTVWLRSARLQLKSAAESRPSHADRRKWQTWPGRPPLHLTRRLVAYLLRLARRGDGLLPVSQAEAMVLDMYRADIRKWLDGDDAKVIRRDPMARMHSRRLETNRQALFWYERRTPRAPRREGGQ